MKYMSIAIVVMACLGPYAIVYLSSSSGNPSIRRTSEDLPLADQKKLLNQSVISIRVVMRPLNSSSGIGPVPHTGVEVVTEDGKHWLIHKGHDYGSPIGGNTVAVDAKRMWLPTNKWSPMSAWTVTKPGVRVTNLIAVGGKNYDILVNNCHRAAFAMYSYAIGFGLKELWDNTFDGLTNAICKVGHYCVAN